MIHYHVRWWALNKVGWTCSNKRRTSCIATALKRAQLKRYLINETATEQADPVRDAIESAKRWAKCEVLQKHHSVKCQKTSTTNGRKTRPSSIQATLLLFVFILGLIDIGVHWLPHRRIEHLISSLSDLIGSITSMYHGLQQKKICNSEMLYHRRNVLSDSSNRRDRDKDLS